MASKLEVKIVKLESRYSEILSRLVAMDKKMDGMDHVIRGNGNPGLVTLMETQEQRIQELEKNKMHWRGFFTTILSGGLVAVFIEMLRHFRP